MYYSNMVVVGFDKRSEFGPSSDNGLGPCNRDNTVVKKNRRVNTYILAQAENQAWNEDKYPNLRLHT